MGFVLANWIALASNSWCYLGRATRQRHGLIAAVVLANALVPCTCQRGSNEQKRNTNTELTPGVIAGIVVVVFLLVFVLSICFFCKRCKGKKQRSAKEQRMARKYEITQSRPSSAVSIISSRDKPRQSYNTNDIEIIDEDDNIPSPFSPT